MYIEKQREIRNLLLLKKYPDIIAKQGTHQSVSLIRIIELILPDTNAESPCIDNKR